MTKPTTSCFQIARRILLALVIVTGCLFADLSWVCNPTLAQSAPPPATPFRTSASRVESCKTNMAIVTAPEPPLSVYSAPSSETGKVVGQLQSGTMVIIATEKDDWFQISKPLNGWIPKQRTESGCNELVEQVLPQAPNTTPFLSRPNGGDGTNQSGQIPAGTRSYKTLIRDRFIGTGSHSYQFQVEKGQVMTITRQSGMFPMVQAPDGTYLMDRRDERRSTWSQKLMQTGTYSVQLDSFYKGYSYSFEVEIP